MRLIRLIIWLIIIILGISFTTLNAVSVELHYSLGSVKVFLPLLVLIVFAIGALAGILIMLPKLWRLRRSRSQLKRQVNKTVQVEVPQ